MTPLITDSTIIVVRLPVDLADIPRLMKIVQRRHQHAVVRMEAGFLIVEKAAPEAEEKKT